MTGSPHRGAYPRLEPDEGKLSCPVLRGGSASNDALLPDRLYFDTAVAGVGALRARNDARALIALGLLLLAISMFWMAHCFGLSAIFYLTKDPSHTTYSGRTACDHK